LRKGVNCYTKGNERRGKNDRKIDRKTGSNMENVYRGGKIGSRLLNIFKILPAVIAFSLAMMVSIQFQKYGGILVIGIVAGLLAITVWIARNIEKQEEKNTKYPFLKRLMGFFSEPTVTFRQSKDDPFSPLSPTSFLF
jgi:hypothetical protein